MFRSGPSQWSAALENRHLALDYHRSSVSHLMQLRLPPHDLVIMHYSHMMTCDTFLVLR